MVHVILKMLEMFIHLSAVQHPSHLFEGKQTGGVFLLRLVSGFG